VIFTLDTNVLVDALRQPAELDRLKTFLSWALPSTVLSSVVVAELGAGARTARVREALEAQFLAPFDRRGRILAPSTGAWRRASLVLGAAGGPSEASRLMDVLLACQAREHGWAVVTRDADFSALRRAIAGLKVVAPFPARP
jgi:predicted nucleic acid-binding protein